MGGDFARNETIVDVGEESFILQWEVADIYTEERWTCMPEGLREDQALGGLMDALLLGPDALVTVRVVSNQGVTIPADMQPEDSWWQTLQIQAQSTTGSIGGTIHLEFEAIGIESITVPAGTFDALAVNVTADVGFGSSTLKYEGTDWFAAGVGRVLSIGEMSGSVTSSYQLELISYSIP